MAGSWASSDGYGGVMAVIEFGGQAFEVTSVSSVSDDEERYEFIATGPGRHPAPNVAIAQKDYDPSKVLYVSIEGEIEVGVLEEIIAYAKDGFEVE